ncbi:hypothetical protein [Arcanobacterium buesumense]|uniref:Uncharacterized protein n=1 Tax=Arcanobacterium buesumense TaxID=2722751 RepID=A0A6H2ELT1_9ACTO|nr:hypothetical protein [Arcanobacterium buesumense]QJC22034.1 hypothetical protein HC352_05635 [Arcanobacterium buesumense]
MSEYQFPEWLDDVRNHLRMANAILDALYAFKPDNKERAKKHVDLILEHLTAAQKMLGADENQPKSHGDSTRQTMRQIEEKQAKTSTDIEQMLESDKAKSEENEESFRKAFEFLDDCSARFWEGRSGVREARALTAMLNGEIPMSKEKIAKLLVKIGKAQGLKVEIVYPSAIS